MKICIASLVMIAIHANLQLGMNLFNYPNSLIRLLSGIPVIITIYAIYMFIDNKGVIKGESRFEYIFYALIIFHSLVFTINKVIEGEYYMLLMIVFIISAIGFIIAYKLGLFNKYNNE